jgi:osmotically inducible lipoprotein OsmB
VAKMAIAAILATLALDGCGTTQGDRTLSGAGVGAGVGAVVGPVGVGLGAVVGAGVGYVTDRDDLYLGRPLWKDHAHSRKRR